MATVEGTRLLLNRAVERGVLHPSNVRIFAGTGLSSAAMGFGAYRVGGGPKAAAHRASLRAALRAGVNLVDTSTHYSASKTMGGSGTTGGAWHGASERLVGSVVAAAVEAGEAAREGVIVCTKVGHVERGAEAPPESISVTPGGVEDDLHSIHPDFLQAEVRASGERLGTNPDIVFLHNPEYFLSAQLRDRVPIADAWDEMYDRLERAFRALESLCDEGVIASGYGVSANFLSCMFSTTGRANLYEALQLQRVLDAAEAAAGNRQHRLRMIQLPLNAIEGGAALGRGNAVPEASEGDSVLAAKRGLVVLANRPLNAIPVPGISSGDWGRSGDSHVVLREVKPMGTVASLLKRVLIEAIGDCVEGVPLQQIALQLAHSSPSIDVALCGMRSERYVEDVAEVLRAPRLTPEQVERALQATRRAMEELGGQTGRLW
eukprot:TRINITY_DN62085_c0_g1_i1.p1 TRINITY_DN62085_c0_g1~~TRINITY_DN62085_c0_g1_i1.p1  ORF type:complete len:474 (-),score=86.50 TRINITY_DN62085_c0_g1_i1:571-1869(-)